MVVPGLEDLEGIGLALALGMLVGLQRGWVLRNRPDGSRFAGIRTYGLLGLAGGIAGALQSRAEGLATVLLAATAALIVLGYWRSSQQDRAVSGTGSLSGLITMACGFLAGTGAFALASAASGTTVLVLTLRTRLHHLVTHIDDREMAAIARFALIALVILPLLPDTPMGPFDAWRPRQLWLVVVLVSGFSFAGYVAARILGPMRGILATAMAGAVVSSTAVTASVAGKMRDGEGDGSILNEAIAAASVVMFLRVMILTAALAPFALPTLATLAVPGMLVSLIGAVVPAMRRPQHPGTASDTVALRNPFAVGPALLLMVLVMALTVAARWVLTRFGDAGLATVLALSGMMDVDSAIITMGNLPAGTLEPRIAGMVLLPPILLNTLVKAGVAISVAGRAKAWPAAATLCLSVVASLVALVLMTGF